MDERCYYCYKDSIHLRHYMQTPTLKRVSRYNIINLILQTKDMRRNQMSFSVIHFSDIHFTGEKDAVVDKIEKLKAACVSSLPNDGDVVIVISGDIAFSGKKHQYDLAREVIETITKYITEQKKSTVHVVCVPGNHDCDYSKNSSIRNTLIEAVRTSSIDTAYYNNVIIVQSEYRMFAESFGINVDNILPRVEIACGKNRILFLLANTAWMSTLNDMPGKILMPTHLFEPLVPEDYIVVFYVFHHPLNWLDPDMKRSFVDHIRLNADMVLMGHEHARDSYEKVGTTFSVFCNHGKELQNSNSEESAFSVISFDNSFQNYSVIDFKWDGMKYIRSSEENAIQYFKNRATKKNVYTPNERILEYANDIGIVLNHFAKDSITLPDLFVWPDLFKSELNNEKTASLPIRSNIIEELHNDSLTIVVGSSSCGKTALAKSLFMLEETKDSCCILLCGKDFTSSDESHIREVIEKEYSLQYSSDYLEVFRQLPKEKRTAVIDDFDLIMNTKGRRKVVLDFLCGFFGRVTIILSSNIELTTILASNTIACLDHVVYYEIMPLGNRKRKEIISKWYSLSEGNLSDEEVNERVEIAVQKINILLGNGNGFVPAIPVFVLSALQNLDAVQQTYSGSQYGFIYESLIQGSLAKISHEYKNPGIYDIDVGVLSKLAFEMVSEKRTSFSEEEINAVISEIEKKHLLRISSADFLRRMERARIIYIDSSCGDIYRFMYPYIFYFFCGRYIAYHFEDARVQEAVEYMCARLYNEIYGNIIIFVCHFANKSDVIDDVLLNAYDTLNDYTGFDFTKTNPVFKEIKDSLNALIPQTIASTDQDISANKEKQLARMDEIGVNDGQMIRGGETIDDAVSETEKDIAAIVASIKTIEVLGEILQNYPVEIDGQKKLEIIDEIHKLGMRAVQAVITTMGYLENGLVEFLYARATKNKKRVNKEDVISATRRFINVLISGMARGMVHQVAVSINSEQLLIAATQALENDDSVSSKLVLLDLKLNCLNHFSFGEVESLKKRLERDNEVVASGIVDSIVGQYLNFNKCDQSLRSKLCSLCGLSQQQVLIASQQNLLN